MQYSKDELNEIFEKLPEQLKDAIVSVDNARIINGVGRKYGLHIDQIGGLAEETGYILLGVVHPTEFVSNLSKRLGIDRVVASQIASDINYQIFLKIREVLKDVQDKKKKDEAEEVEPEPSKDALLAALEHPEGMLKRPLAPSKVEREIPLVEVRNPYQPAKPEMGKDFPVVAPTPVSKKEGVVTSPTPAQDMLSQKFGGEVSMPKVETNVDAPPTKRVDPYKEQI